MNDKKKAMNVLTKAEEQVMQILWQIDKGFVKDILAKMSTPQPAYNTVSTIVRILEQKGFVAHVAFGKTHEYYPIVAKDKYRKFFLNNFLKSYFSGSFENMLSFFAKENNLDISDMEKLIGHVQQDLNKKEHE